MKEKIRKSKKKKKRNGKKIYGKGKKITIEKMHKEQKICIFQQKIKFSFLERERDR